MPRGAPTPIEYRALNLNVRGMGYSPTVAINERWRALGAAGIDCARPRPRRRFLRRYRPRMMTAVERICDWIVS